MAIFYYYSIYMVEKKTAKWKGLERHYYPLSRPSLLVALYNPQGIQCCYSCNPHHMAMQTSQRYIQGLYEMLRLQRQIIKNKF